MADFQKGGSTSEHSNCSFSLATLPDINISSINLHQGLLLYINSKFKVFRDSCNYFKAPKLI